MLRPALKFKTEKHPTPLLLQEGRERGGCGDSYGDDGCVGLCRSFLDMGASTGTGLPAAQASIPPSGISTNASRLAEPRIRLWRKEEPSFDAAKTPYRHELSLVPNERRWRFSTPEL